jgi:hypothetical protein
MYERFQWLLEQYNADGLKDRRAMKARNACEWLSPAVRRDKV